VDGWAGHLRCGRRGLNPNGHRANGGARGMLGEDSWVEEGRACPRDKGEDGGVELDLQAPRDESVGGGAGVDR